MIREFVAWFGLGITVWSVVGMIVISILFYLQFAVR